MRREATGTLQVFEIALDVEQILYTFSNMNRFIFPCVILGLLTACEATPPPDLNAPPTEWEFQTLGADALNEYFLTRWRKCTQWYSDTECLNEMYGGDNGME